MNYVVLSIFVSLCAD